MLLPYGISYRRSLIPLLGYRSYPYSISRPLKSMDMHTMQEDTRSSRAFSTDIQCSKWLEQNNKALYASKYYRPHFKRDSKFGKITPEVVKGIQALVEDPKSQVLTISTLESSKLSDVDLQLLNTYFIDWLHIYTPECVKGSLPLIVFPYSATQVQNIVQFCNSHNIAITIQSGNTGLVGGSVPVYDEIIISLKKMNKILDFDPETGVLCVEAGCTVHQISEFLASQSGKQGDIEYPQYIYPLDLGSKGSCCIGGTIATCAGGNRFIRYKSAHDYVLGLEAIIGNGDRINYNNRYLKNNSHLHLHHLWIGSEGTLGVITKAIIQCPVKPKSVQVALFKVPGGFANIRQVCAKAKRDLSDILSALEFFDPNCMSIVTHPKFGISKCLFSSLSSKPSGPISYSHEPHNHFYLLVETHGQNEVNDKQRLYKFSESIINEEYVVDGIIGENSTEIDSLWRLREYIPTLANDSCEKVLKYDISLPISKMYEPIKLLNAAYSLLHKDNYKSDIDAIVSEIENSDVVESINKREPLYHFKDSDRDATNAIAIGYGHVGDGNIHVNVLLQNTKDGEALKCIQNLSDKLMFNYVTNAKGSISAEHGMGVLKAGLISKLQTPEFVNLLLNLKSSYDPKGILNPYKGFRIE